VFLSIPAQQFFSEAPVSPLREAGAYEHLWLQPGATFKRLAELFVQNRGALPSALVEPEEAEEAAGRLLGVLGESGVRAFGIRLHGANQYPERLRDAVSPVELFYCQGAWELADAAKAVAVVGSRKPSAEGAESARELVQQLVDLDYTIVSGLAAGIDTVAHETAIASRGNTIAVLGTPITDTYPSENRPLQERIAAEHLVISQVPILRYREQDWRANRGFFPERNKTMSALTQATIIVEAGETSGTLIQAKAALQQGRKLFILERCFHNKSISWPAKYEAQGAIRVRSVEDIKWGLDAD
jgi:DNA processing protein